MSEQDLLTQYNYDEFIPEKFERWMRFAESPVLGTKGPSFPLWKLDGREETSLKEVVSANLYTVVEFGSFT